MVERAVPRTVERTPGLAPHDLVLVGALAVTLACVLLAPVNLALMALGWDELTPKAPTRALGYGAEPIQVLGALVVVAAAPLVVWRLRASRELPWLSLQEKAMVVAGAGTAGLVTPVLSVASWNGPPDGISFLLLPLLGGAAGAGLAGGCCFRPRGLVSAGIGLAGSLVGTLLGLLLVVAPSVSLLAFDLGASGYLLFVAVAASVALFLAAVSGGTALVVRALAGFCHRS